MKLNSKDLLEQKTRIQNEMRNLLDNPSGEGGDLSDEQERRFEQLKLEFEKTERQIERRQFIDSTDRESRGTVVAGNGGSADSEIRRLANFIEYAVQAGTPGGNPMSTRAAGLQETIGSEGGFLVNTDFSTSLLAAVNERSQFLPLVTRLTISSGSNGMKLSTIDETSRADGSRYGGAAAYWTAEAGQITSSKVKFRQLQMELKKLACLYYASDELLQDAPMLAQALRNFYAGEIAFKIDDGILNGSGAGQLLGIFNSGAVVTVSKEAGQANDTVLIENVVKMFSRVPPRNRSKAVWIVSQTVEPQLYTMSLAVGTGGSPIFLPGGNASSSPYSSLLGRPIIVCEQCPTLGNVGDISLIDFSEYVLIDKGGVSEASSIGVRFEYAETAFRAIYRCDGQPTWASTLTPFNGGDPISPYVVLEARS